MGRGVEGLMDRGFEGLESRGSRGSRVSRVEGLEVEGQCTLYLKYRLSHSIMHS